MAGFRFAAIAAALLSSTFAQAQEDPYAGGTRQRERRGIYLGLGGGGGIQLASGSDARFGFGGEVKIGYALNRKLQVYLSGALNSADHSGLAEVQHQILITAHAHQFLYQDRSLGVFVDAGIGFGFMTPGYLVSRRDLGIGIGYGGSLGIEIALGPSLSLVPEFYYRSVNPQYQDGTAQIHAIGLQLGIVYY